MTEELHFGSVWFLYGEKRGRYPGCNSVYIEGAQILIDPTATRERLEEIREKEGVKEIWLSHVHEDHIKYLSSLFRGCGLGVSAEDAPAITDIELMLDSYGAEGKTRDYWRDYILKNFDYEPRRVTRILKPGEVIDLGKTKVEVIATPGHTPGHLSFYFREEGIMFLADYDLTKFGPWYGDRRSSIEDTLSTLEKLRKIPAKIWLTSHETGAVEGNPGELWDNYLQVINVREEKLLKLLGEPRTLEEIIGACIIYWMPREPAGFFDLGERGHMIKHLEKLMKEKRIYREGDKYIRA